MLKISVLVLGIVLTTLGVATTSDRWQDNLRTTTVIGNHTFNAKN